MAGTWWAYCWYGNTVDRLFRTLISLALHRGHRISTFRYTVLRLFFLFRIPFLNCILPPEFYHVWSRCLPFLGWVSSISLWSVLLACGRFFGLGGIEESRDSFRDAWFSLLSVLPLCESTVLSSWTAAPSLCLVIYVAETSKDYSTSSRWRCRVDLINQHTALR